MLHNKKRNAFIAFCLVLVMMLPTSSFGDRSKEKASSLIGVLLRQTSGDVAKDIIIGNMMCLILINAILNNKSCIRANRACNKHEAEDILRDVKTMGCDSGTCECK